MAYLVSHMVTQLSTKLCSAIPPVIAPLIECACISFDTLQQPNTKSGWSGRAERHATRDEKIGVRRGLRPVAVSEALNRCSTMRRDPKISKIPTIPIGWSLKQPLQ
eukprot:SAG11_NODE_18665_length_484_cov_1.054545_1_plen_105_part_01